MTRPMPFVVVASPEIAPRSPGGMSLKRRPHASVITVPPAIATTKISARYHACHSRPEPACEQPDAVDGGRERDDAREADPVTDRAGDERRDDVAPCHRAEDVRRRDERLAEPDGDVEHDERPRAGERSFPRGVRDEEGRDVAGSERSTRQECATYVRTPSNTRPWPPSSVTSRTGTRHATVTTNAATRNGAGLQRWKRNPPPISAPRARPRGRRAARPAPARTRCRAGRRGTGRDTAARRRSRRRRARRA